MAYFEDYSCLDSVGRNPAKEVCDASIDTRISSTTNAPRHESSQFKGTCTWVLVYERATGITLAGVSGTI